MPQIEIGLVLLAQGRELPLWEEARRKVRKIRRIGILGALNGARIRSWFEAGAAAALRIEDLEATARRHGIPFQRAERMNSRRTAQLLKEAQVDLGISLGSPYLQREIFTIPRQGMVNVHHEILPQFQGARSILWPIHEGSRETGYSIHRIDARLDAGPILHQERFPIEFKPTLRETVILNYARLVERSALGLAKVLKDYPGHKARAVTQRGGRSFTTPTIGQYLQMVRQHQRLYRDTHG